MAEPASSLRAGCFVLQKPGMPRRPGTFPDGYPVELILLKSPIPGQPLERRFLGTTTPAVVTSTTSSLPQRSSLNVPRVTRIDRAMTVRGQAPRISVVAAAFAEFPPLDAAPPMFRPRRHRYPSGSRSGTDMFPSFVDKLKEVRVNVIRRMTMRSPTTS
jgi:hypothetical protein